MTSTPPAGEPPDPHDRELDDLITSHLDGGLDAAGQRRLAALLAATPGARATLVRHLRLESAIVRLARAGGLGSGIAAAAPTAPPPTIAAAPAVRPPWRIRPAAIALAGSVVAAAIALLVISRRDRPAVQSADIAAVAERWIDLRVPDADGVDPDWTEDEDAESNRGSPPSWLVAALADDDNV